MTQPCFDQYACRAKIRSWNVRGGATALGAAMRSECDPVPSRTGAKAREYSRATRSVRPLAKARDCTVIVRRLVPTPRDGALDADDLARD